MDNHLLFEELYQSVIQQEDNQSKKNLKRPLQNVSNHKRSYSLGRHRTFTSRNMSETIIISHSKQSAMSTYSIQNETAMITSTRSELHTTICKAKDSLSANKDMHQECNSEFSEPNAVITMSDESICQDDSEAECSNSQNTCEVVDGYQSGESKMSEVQRLCKDCKNLYKKLRKRNRSTVIKDPHITDPRLLYSKSWIFVNRISARGSKKTLKRSLESVLKRLRSRKISRSSPAAGIYWICCRAHIFLKRNFRLCKMDQKRFGNQGEKKRKQPNSGRKARKPKKSMPSKQAEETVPQVGKKAHKTYSFVFDSSQEENYAGPEIKRYKMEIKNTGRKFLLSQSETHNSSSGGSSA